MSHIKERRLRSICWVVAMSSVDFFKPNVSKTKCAQLYAAFFSLGLIEFENFIIKLNVLDLISMRMIVDLRLV